MWTNELPTKPGVYLWRIKEGEPVFVRQLSHGYRPNLVDVFTDDHQYAANLRGQWLDLAGVIERLGIDHTGLSAAQNIALREERKIIDRIAAMEKRLEAIKKACNPKMDHAKISAILGSEIGGGNPNAPFGQRKEEAITYDVGDVVKNEGDTLVATTGPAVQSPLAALAEKLEECPPHRVLRAHDVAAELRAALAAVEPSEDEIEKAAEEWPYMRRGFLGGVRWMLSKIKGIK